MNAASSKKPPSTTASERHGIVCGTDFSPEAQRAAEVAAAIAGRFGEPLMLTHAIEVPQLGAAREKFVKWMSANRKHDLRKQADFFRRGGVQVKASATVGRADDVLCDLAENRGARMMIMASQRRRGPLDRWLLGSAIERTAQRSTIPTLVVREPETLTAWAHGDRPLKVFVCFNFTATSRAALSWVKELCAIGRCEVVIALTNWPFEEHVRLGGAGPIPLDRNSPEVQSALERDLRAQAAQLLGKISFRVRVESNWGRTDFRLAHMAREEGADLVVVGSHQYRGFERLWHASVSRGLLHEAEMNLAVVPLATEEAHGPTIAPPVRRVLVSTDFSDASNAAIAHAYSIVRGGGAVHLVHVLPLPVGIPGGEMGRKSSAKGSTAANARKFQQCAAQLRALIPADAASYGISTHVEVVASRDVATGVCQLAERLAADVICLSTHGRSGFAKTLLGSVATAMMERSRRPLLVVRPEPL